MVFERCAHDTYACWSEVDRHNNGQHGSPMKDPARSTDPHSGPGSHDSVILGTYRRTPGTRPGRGASAFLFDEITRPKPGPWGLET